MMKMFNILLGAAMISFSAAATETPKTEAPVQPAKGVVKSNVLNVRVKPGPHNTVVSKLKRGDEVAVLRQVKEWCEIVVPPDASVWIAASQLKDGKTISESMLRAGPGVAYEAYVVTIPDGAEVTVQDKSKPDWIKIAAPSTLTGWVSKEFVNVSGDNAKKADSDVKTADAVKDSGAKDKSDDKKTKTADKTAGKEKSLPFVADSDKNVTVEGIVSQLDKKDAIYVTHALFKQQKDGNLVPVCFLHSAKQSLAPWNEKSVQIKGKQRKVRGWKTPVVEVEKIIPQV
jgi:uncharacterized protein YgiM (DUF1202 family)